MRVRQLFSFSAGTGCLESGGRGSGELLNEDEINYGDLHFCCWLFSKDIILECLDVGYVLWQNRRCIFGIESWENGDL